MQSRVFDVVVRESDAETVVGCSGEIDVATAERFEGALGDALAHARPVLVDLSEVRFIDSSGIRSLVRFARRCREGEIRFQIRMSAQVERVCDILGVTELLGSSGQAG